MDRGGEASSHVCPKSARISRAPGPLQDAGPAGRPGPVAVVCQRQTCGAEERRRGAGTRSAGAGQGRPVPGTHPRGWVQAPGVAEWTRGEGRQIYDTHDPPGTFANSFTNDRGYDPALGGADDQTPRPSPCRALTERDALLHLNLKRRTPTRWYVAGVRASMRLGAKLGRRPLSRSPPAFPLGHPRLRTPPPDPR